MTIEHRGHAPSEKKRDFPMSHPIDKTLCPFCRQPNGCMLHTDERCWCMEVTVPQGLIELVPPALQRQACICRVCIEKYTADPAAFVAEWQR